MSRRSAWGSGDAEGCVRVFMFMEYVAPEDILGLFSQLVLIPRAAILWRGRCGEVGDQFVTMVCLFV